ncbi:hypothetical protein [Gayadomonas joobiniege]|uniref:hypothetical protein n=1 Tax=Gayadomonas joobiniege TaxID=1234606 RepID=UPI00035D6C92|nr:hypothetical protein [Gayadomonas joobiniege]
MSTNKRLMSFKRENAIKLSVNDFDEERINRISRQIGERKATTAYRLLQLALNTIEADDPNSVSSIKLELTK